jgi:hypothetical protein
VLFPLIATIAAFTAVFTAVHAWVRLRIEPDFHRAFRLSRGFAAILLTTVGFCGLLVALPQWRVGFLYRHDADDWMVWGVALAYGHLLSDFIWMAIGYKTDRIKPRADLLIHHSLAAIGYAYAMIVSIGYGVVLLSLASELMPCFTGLEAWGKFKQNQATQLRAARARLVVLILWRIPLWSFSLAMYIHTIQGGVFAPGLETPTKFVAASFILLLGLDLYWVRKCLPAWKAPTPQV